MDAIQPRPDEPTPAARRRWGRSAAVVAAFVAGSVLSGGGAVWASHQYSDVPDSSPFHNDIDWVTYYGIAQGYTDGTFKPTNPVSRQAMAAFLHRYNDALTREETSYDPTPGSTFIVTTVCPVGRRALAGGGAIGTVNAFITDSRPDSFDAWYVRWESEGNATLDPTQITGWVLCAPL